jgi:predicted lipase
MFGNSLCCTACEQQGAHTADSGMRPFFDAPGGSSKLLVEHTMNYLSRLEEGLTESLGPWTYLHSLGAAVVLLVAVSIAVNIWPGWQQLGEWLW